MNNKIPSKFLNKHPISSDIELTVAEFHQNKRKWLSFCVYKPPNQNDSVFMESICAIINEYSVQCEHRVIFGYFNMSIENSHSLSSMQIYDLSPLIKEPI